MPGKKRFPCAFNKKLVPSAKTVAKKLKNFDSCKKKNEAKKELDPDKLIALNDAAEEKTVETKLTWKLTPMNSSMKAMLKSVFDDVSSDDDSTSENEENNPELVERMKKRNEELARTNVSFWNSAASTSPLHEKIDENLAETSRSSLKPTMSIPEQSESQPSKHNVGSSQVKEVLSSVEDLSSSAVERNGVFEAENELQKCFVNCSKSYRKGSSLVWNYMGHLCNEGGEIVDNQYFYCSKCLEIDKVTKFKYKTYKYATSNIWRHLRNIHSVGGVAPSQVVYTCDLCSKTFNAKGNIEFHMQHVHIAKSSASDSSDFKVVCHSTGKTTSVLWKFFGSLVHPDGSDVEDQANFYHCKLCVEGRKILTYRYKRSKTTKALKYHLKRQHPAEYRF